MIEKGDKFIEHFVVSADVHSAFIALFHDRHLLHTDADYAKALGFKSVVMHGNILNGFLSYFIGKCLPEADVMILSQEIKFSQPVYLNDHLTLEVEVVDVHDSVQLIELVCKFRNDNEKLVASAKMNIGKIGHRRSSSP